MKGNPAFDAKESPAKLRPFSFEQEWISPGILRELRHHRSCVDKELAVTSPSYFMLTKAFFSRPVELSEVDGASGKLFRYSSPEPGQILQSFIHIPSQYLLSFYVYIAARMFYFSSPALVSGNESEDLGIEGSPLR
ncbi:hypothetical protein Pint_16087 [Pistacia integerrima]|uniref:Uncharacterized protein n=1 Tax=Pistacia integerrima TaxID=434235 RepID=A0ACC0Z9A6_9ROSI|nr:hypothetical protein Pint_16087 [Pistacia integerrima]